MALKRQVLVRTATLIDLAAGLFSGTILVDYCLFYRLSAISFTTRLGLITIAVQVVLTVSRQLHLRSQGYEIMAIFPFWTSVTLSITFSIIVRIHACYKLHSIATPGDRAFEVHETAHTKNRVYSGIVYVAVGRRRDLVPPLKRPSSELFLETGQFSRMLVA
jgi:hypothetical protein